MWVTIEIVTALSALAALGYVVCAARRLDARLAAILEEQGKSRRGIELDLAAARAALDAQKNGQALTVAPGCSLRAAGD